MALINKLPIFRCFEDANEVINTQTAERKLNTAALAKDIGIVVVAAVSVFALGYFSSLTALLVKTPYVGTLAGRFTAFPFVSQAAILGILSAPGLAIGLGASLAASAVMAAVKAKTVLTFFNLALQLSVGLYIMSKWSAKALDFGVFSAFKHTIHELTYGRFGEERKVLRT